MLMGVCKKHAAIIIQMINKEGFFLTKTGGKNIQAIINVKSQMEPLTFSAREAFHKKVFHVMEYCDVVMKPLSIPFAWTDKKGFYVEQNRRC